MAFSERLHQLLTEQGTPFPSANSYPTEAGGISFLTTLERLLDQAKAKNAYYYWVPVNHLDEYANNINRWKNNHKIYYFIYYFSTVPASLKAQQEGLERVSELLTTHLFKSKILFSDVQVVHLCQAFTNPAHHIPHYNWPLLPLCRSIEKSFTAVTATPLLRATLQALCEAVEQNKLHFYDQKGLEKVLTKLNELIFAFQQGEKPAIRPVLFREGDAFGAFANPQLQQLPEQDQLYWHQLLALAEKATGGKPSDRFLADAQGVLAALGHEPFREYLHPWLEFLGRMKPVATSDHYTQYRFLVSPNADLLKGLIWMSSLIANSQTLRLLSRVAAQCYQKAPGSGPVAPSVGNACLYALFRTGMLEGIGLLSRLRLRIKQSNTQTLIESYIRDAARQLGVSPEVAEDYAIESHGLTDGMLAVAFGDYTAVLSITAAGKSEIAWQKADGSPLKAAPAVVKGPLAEALKTLKETQKQLDITTSTQRDRLDRMFRTKRTWELDFFREYYQEHGVMSFLVKRLLWNFDDGQSVRTGCWLPEQRSWADITGQAFVPAAGSVVSLWHPATAPMEETRQWRTFLSGRQLQQPVKQAYREVYLLTDAEIHTRTYSNRMAAHLLKQHQFNSLAKTRGWKYSLLGAYDDGRDSASAACLLPEYTLRAEFWVNEVNEENAWNESGIWNYVTTDQVRFVNLATGDPIPLIDVPPLVFTEVMRDVDLFVGVASVGNDPTWQDSGGMPAHRGYWQQYAFGDLTELANTRKEILASLVPRLKISKIATLSDRFLVVQGKLRTYKIHLGSSNILMEPNDQYLCIVPDQARKNAAQGIFLPFEGDNTLALILSKAFLLAADDKITDPTITRQIYQTK